jgi:hypothetical protein
MKDSLVIRLLGILCYLGIVAYWYFVPYQVYLGLINTTKVWTGVGDTVILVVSIIIGIVITILVGVVGIALLTVN